MGEQEIGKYESNVRKEVLSLSLINLATRKYDYIQLQCTNNINLKD